VPNLRRISKIKAPNANALAWELVAAARSHLSRVEADPIYIAIGIGETFDAIDALITAIVRQRIPVGVTLAATVTAWLDFHVGQDAEPRLRQLISEMNTYRPPWSRNDPWRVTHLA
jgi:hypothetical protein